MTACERGDAILVPFPFSDQSTTKKRPALVISSNTFNRSSPDLIIMAITSQTKRKSGVGEYQIKDWESAGLLKPSAIKPAISTIEQSLVLKTLGKLAENDLEMVDKVLCELLLA